MQAHLRVLVGVLAVGALGLAVAKPVYGHAVVLETVPADGALLERAPDQVVIQFNEPVALVGAQVLDRAGNDTAPRNAVSASGATVRIVLPPGLAEGSYVASYRVMSMDSHPVGGSIVFSVGSVSNDMAAPVSTGNDRGWKAATAAIRAILYCGILGGAGAVLFLLLVRPTGATWLVTARIASALAAAGSLAALLAIGIQGGLLSGGPVSSLASGATWKLGLTSSYGATAVTAMVGLALVAAGLRWKQQWLRPVGYFGAVAALTSFALSGHVVTAGPRWLTIPVLIVHTAAVAFWIGALAPLHQAVGRLGGQAAPIIQRFSRIAVGAVAVLVGSGLVIAVLQVASVQAFIQGFIDTRYGLILFVKLAFVAGLLSLATANKLRLTPALVQGKRGAERALRGTIMAEIGFVLAILFATSALGTVPPPRALAEAASGEGAASPAHVEHRGTGLSVTIVNAGRSSEIVLASAHAGTNRAELTLLNDAGRPMAVKEVTLTAANVMAGVEPISRKAEAIGPGAWRVENLVFVPAGNWSIQIEVLISDFEKVVFETAIAL